MWEKSFLQVEKSPDNIYICVISGMLLVPVDIWQEHMMIQTKQSNTTYSKKNCRDNATIFPLYNAEVSI